MVLFLFSLTLAVPLSAQVSHPQKVCSNTIIGHRETIKAGKSFESFSQTLCPKKKQRVPLSVWGNSFRIGKMTTLFSAISFPLNCCKNRVAALHYRWCCFFFHFVRAVPFSLHNNSFSFELKRKAREGTSWSAQKTKSGHEGTCAHTHAHTSVEREIHIYTYTYNPICTYTHITHNIHAHSHEGVGGLTWHGALVSRTEDGADIDFKFCKRSGEMLDFSTPSGDFSPQPAS